MSGIVCFGLVFSAGVGLQDGCLREREGYEQGNVFGVRAAVCLVSHFEVEQALGSLSMRRLLEEAWMPDLTVKVVVKALTIVSLLMLIRPQSKVRPNLPCPCLYDTTRLQHQALLLYSLCLWTSLWCP